MAKVYIQTDDRQRAVDINSDIFLADTDGWIEVDEGEGDKYAHAQGNYFDPPLLEEHGVPLWAWDGEQVVRRSDEDVQADIDALPPPLPSLLDEMQAVIDTLMGRDSNG